MQKIFKNKISLFIIVLTLWSNSIFADDDPGGLGNDPGAPVPIDSWISIALFIGTAIVFFYTNKKKKSITN